MTTYVDIETSAEALKEDEELIEAVEAAVETAAVAVYSGIKSDVEEFRETLYRIIVMLFPVILDYKEDRSLLRADLEKLALAALLFLIGFFVLAPSQGHGPLKRGGRRHLMSKNRSESLGSIQTSPKENSFGPSEEESGESDFITDEETDEERFEKMWPSVISQSRYKRLVLPPECKLVEKAKYEKAELERAISHSREKKLNDVVDDPVARLQTYFHHFLYFIRSILSFDYAGAGWALICWMQGIQRYRRTNSDPHIEDDHDVDDVSVASSKASVRAGNATAVASPVPKEPILPVSQKKILSPLEEEKKDFLDEMSPVRPLRPRPLERLESDGSVYYETPVLSDDSSENDVGVQVPPLIRRVILNKRDGSAKNKDALGSYRVSHDLTSTIPLARSDSSNYLSNLRKDIENEPHDSESHTGSHPKSHRFFFETAQSRDSLKRLTVEVPLPDKNGYIVGDDYLPDSSYTPLLVFVNSRSGAQQGHMLISQLKRLLNPIQIWDLANGGPEEVLESFCVLTRLRVLVCGGDGTVSWIISALEKMNLRRKWPPIAILPLGTGNDLARIHGWGGGYNNESLLGILEQIAESYISLLDRWEVTIDDRKNKKKESRNFFNYLGVGADAQAALQVHNLRESRPQWFFSRVVNKAFYGVFGAEDVIMASCANLRKEVKLYADGIEVPLPADSQGIICLNIDAYAGGVPLWSHGVKSEVPTVPSLVSPRRTQSLGAMTLKMRSDSIDRVDSVDDFTALLSEEERHAKVTACDMPSSCQDGYLDVVSIRGAFHLGQIQVGLSHAQRLCQCREAKIVIKRKVAVQVDGEPWRQPPCTLYIRRKPESALMLHRSADDGGVETEMSKLLDWAEERKLIDSQVHSILMKEFSRRIESKTRKRRVREKDNIMHTLKKAISQGTLANMGGSQPWSGGVVF